MYGVTDMYIVPRFITALKNCPDADIEMLFQFASVPAEVVTAVQVIP